jgi:hypothetical protein
MRCSGRMRGFVLVLVCGLIGCKGKNANETSGSASTAGSGSATTVAVAADAAPPIDAMVTPVAATGPTLTAKGGLSTLSKLPEQADEEATAKAIEKKLGLPGIVVSFDVMDVPGEIEREEGYWSVKRGETEIIQLLRTMPVADQEGPLAVVVWTDEVATADGIKVGDTFATLVAKHPDVKCKAGAIADLVQADILCRDPKEKELGYLMSRDKAKVKAGKVTPDTTKIIAIGHEF